MSIEAPIRIDLSQDNPWDATNLTQEEKNYLQEQFTKERNEALYLTRGELVELSRIIETQRNSGISPVVRGIMTWELDKFIDNQIAEWLSTTDMLEWIDNIPEWFAELLETKSHEQLFGDEGIMKGIDLTWRAKNYITTAFSLAILEELGSSSEILDANLEGLLTHAWERLQYIKEAFEDTRGSRPWQPLNNLRIQWLWEENHIFMNIEKGKEFFTQVLDGKLWESDAIIAYIQEQNLADWETVESADLKTLAALRSTASEDVAEIVENITDPDTGIPVADMTPDEKKSLIERWKESDSMLLQILAGLLEFMKEISGGKTWEEKKWWETETKTGEAVKLDLKGQTISLSHTWVSDQIWESVNDTQNPSIQEIRSILEEYKNKNFSQADNLPENSARAIYALQVAISSAEGNIWIIDGIYGPNTEAWIAAYREKFWLTPSRGIDTALFESLLGHSSLQEEDN